MNPTAPLLSHFPGVDSTQLQRAAGIRLIVLDVDGVLTDGKISYTSDGQEIKSFNVKDGLGMTLAVREGYQLGIITARESAMVTRRMQELGVPHVIQNTRTKRPALESLLETLGLGFEHLAYMGDDLPDIPCLELAGLATCPADAARAVRQICHWVSGHRGGEGAVRELVELLLAARQHLGATPPS